MCHLPIPDGTKNGRRCYPCVQREREKDRQNKVYGMVGTACWVCGYDKGMKGTGVLDFHHMNPDDKIFGLDKRNTTNWYTRSLITIYSLFDSGCSDFCKEFFASMLVKLVPSWPRCFLVLSRGNAN